MTMTACAKYIWHGMTRRKTLEKDLMATPLKRCLKWWHLTFFGIGQMAGAGVYVLTGAVAFTTSGPATFISYIIAGVCAFLSALCYAEFGARCPKAGSAYTYAYLTIGEFLGFSLGWNLLLEHCIGAASTARAWGGALNALSNNAIKNWTLENIGKFEAFGMAQYPDFFALLIILILTVIIIYGAQESMMLNCVVAGINMLATVFVAAIGFHLAEGVNWTEPHGLMPFGFSGVLSGAAMCFYAYVGFDGIAMAGEEAENPGKALPIANAVSMVTVMVMYVLMSTSLTLTVPYNEIDPSAPFAFAFSQRGLEWAAIVVTLASLVAITGTTLGNLFAVPRCAYSMATDGLLFRSLAYVHPRTQTPIVAILCFTVISGICAVILDLETLAEFVSLGTLFAAYFVSGCVIILRYQPRNECQFECSADMNEDVGMLKPRFRHWPWFNRQSPGVVAKWCVASLELWMMIAAAIFLQDAGDVAKGVWWVILIGILAILACIISFIGIVLHVQNENFPTYQMPFVPLLPTLSMATIACLLVRLSGMAWVRFLVWMAVGLVIYFGYGIRKSSENKMTLSSYSRMDYESTKTATPNGTKTTDSIIDKEEHSM